MQSSSQVGSEGWIGGEAYSGDDDYRLRIESFQSSFSTTNLLAQASSLRGDIKCSLSGTFSVGSFNFVRKITFADGAEWVARLRMPSIDRPDEGITDALRYKMQSEVDTMKFIRYVLFKRDQLMLGPDANSWLIVKTQRFPFLGFTVITSKKTMWERRISSWIISTATQLRNFRRP